MSLEAGRVGPLLVQPAGRDSDLAPSHIPLVLHKVAPVRLVHIKSISVPLGVGTIHRYTPGRIVGDVWCGLQGVKRSIRVVTPGIFPATGTEYLGDDDDLELTICRRLEQRDA